MDKNTILIAPTAFKGSLSAEQVAAVMADVMQTSSSDEAALPFDSCPLADGGDDTLAVLAKADPSVEVHTLEVTGPLPGQRLQARYGVQPEKGIAILEAAQAHGIIHLPNRERHPLTSTSYGVGELMLAAARQHPGLSDMVLTLGGSASTDGGLGALQALGTTCHDAQGKALQAPLAGKDLHQLQAIDLQTITLPPLPVWIATDVENPLLGPQGTARVFAPQKGAGTQEIELLEEGLAHFASLLEQITGQDHTSWPRTGAAGGLSFGLSYLPGARLVSGFNWLADFLNLDERIAQSRLILTGEGRLDQTSFSGKVIGNLIQRAQQQTPPTPIVIFCGQQQEGLTVPQNVHVFPLVGPDGCSPEQAMADPIPALASAIQKALPLMRTYLG